jgi:hypothetical protein
MVRSYIDEEHWAALPASIREDLFDQTVQQIWDHLSDAASEEKLDGDGESMAWVDLELDDQGMEELGTAMAELLDRAMEIQSESIARLADLPESERADQAHRTELALMHFHRAAKTRVSASKPRRKRK